MKKCIFFVCFVYFWIGGCIWTDPCGFSRASLKPPHNNGDDSPGLRDNPFTNSSNSSVPWGFICLPCQNGSHSTVNCSTLYHDNHTEVLCSSGFCIPSLTGINCSLCQPGYFQELSMTNSCKPCEVLSFNPNFGATECQICQPGFYCPETGQREQTECPGGYYCDGSRCPKSCPPGYRCTGQRNSFPLPCDEGYACPENVDLPIACQPGQFCGKECVRCQDCPFTPFMTSGEASGKCSPSVFLYIFVVVVTVIVVFIIVFLVSYCKKRNAADRQTAESSTLIPRAEGPRYTGL